MKHVVFAVMVVSMILGRTSASFAKANEAQLLPTLHVGKSQTDLYGFTWFSYDQASVTDFDIRKLRVRLDSRLEKWSLFLDADLNNGILHHFGNQSNNWLVEGRLGYSLSDNWQIRVGRLFLTGGCPTPPPFLLETVRYPRFPLSLAAWGIQLKGTEGKWDFLSEITGASNAPYDSSDGFDRFELGVRAKRHLSEGHWIAGTSQISEEFARLAFDGEFIPSRYHELRWALYAVHERDLPDLFGGYIFYAQHPTRWLEAHVQIDHQSGNDLLTTIGVRFSFWKDRFSLIVDYEYNVEDNEGTVLVRPQFRY